MYGVGGAFCQCSPGFEGEWCERSSNDKANLTDACSGVRCANGGWYSFFYMYLIMNFFKVVEKIH